MVGLGIVLEEAESKKNISINNNNNNTHQKSTFLDQCFLCNKKLLPEKDIYMYKGDRAFCSVDCRCKQILRDEEEAIEK
ncbi:FCS-Like Zinc finger 15 [Trifolium repens]|nr:FCS-Like Zinc finger 15 [Trifolium repens]